MTFNSSVTVIGDGSQAPVTIEGESLFDFDGLIKVSNKYGDFYMDHTVDTSHSVLQEKVRSIKSAGRTALGPALLAAIGLAGAGKPGSSVVLCTDGLANHGLGQLSRTQDEEAMQKATEFYERTGMYAKEKGVTVNITSIIGEECDIETLSIVTEMTGGNVDRVEPETLMSNVSSMLSVPVIANNVTTKVKIHMGLEFRNEAKENLSDDRTLLVRQLGNVTEESEITFEYRLKDLKELEKISDIDFEKLEKIPFQTQIYYTTLDGMKCIRVITSVQDVSHEREEVEQNANVALLNVNAAQQAARMAQRGDFRGAQSYAVGQKRFAKKNLRNEDDIAAYGNWNAQMNGMFGMLQQQQKVEKEFV